MVEPIASQYQGSADPGSVFQPSIQSSDSDYGDEKKAVGQYQQTYGTQGSDPQGGGTPSTAMPTDPTLSMAYTTAPDLIPLPSTGGQSSGSSTAPQPMLPVYIELATLMSTETSFLKATSTVADQYEHTLEPVVQNAINTPTMWGTNVTIGPHQGGNQKAAELTGTGYQVDSLDAEGTKFAASINPAMDQLLVSVGNVVEAMGVFTALLNKTGQYYTSTDSQSVFPPPGLMEGPNPPVNPPSS